MCTFCFSLFFYVGKKVKKEYMKKMEKENKQKNRKNVFWVVVKNGIFCKNVIF